MNPILRTARERGFELLVVTGYSIVLAFALHGDHWISDYVLYTVLRCIFAVAGGLLAALVLRTVALWFLGGGGIPSAEAGARLVDPAADGSLAHPGAPHLRVVQS